MATKIDFASLQLEPIDMNTYSNTRPDLYINRTGITFSRGVLECLNYPAYVQYLLDPQNKVFALRACKGTETKAKAFSKPRGEQSNTISTNVKALQGALTRLIPNYSEAKRYMIEGQFVSNDKTVYFVLPDAVEKTFFKDKQ